MSGYSFSDLVQKEMYILAYMMRGIPTSRHVIIGNRLRQIHIHTPTGRLMFSIMLWKQAFARFDIFKEIQVMQSTFETHPTEIDKEFIYAIARISDTFDLAVGAVDGACADLKRSYGSFASALMSDDAQKAFSDLSARSETFKTKIMVQIYGE